LARPAEFFGAYPIIAGFACYVKRKKQKKKRVIPAFLLKKKSDNKISRNVKVNNYAETDNHAEESRLMPFLGNARICSITKKRDSKHENKRQCCLQHILSFQVMAGISPRLFLVKPKA
jgi:hypothetical protein